MTKKRKPYVADDIVRGLRNAAAFLDGKPGSARVHVSGTRGARLSPRRRQGARRRASRARGVRSGNF